MTPPHLLLRADADSQIGSGHVMRCLALAEAWQDAGGQATFACAGLAARLRSRLVVEGFAVASVEADRGSQADADQTIALGHDLGAAVIVADGYRFGPDYQDRIAQSKTLLVLVDDCGHAGPYLADVILNQNLHADEAAYARRAPYTELLLGPRYALLRREFRCHPRKARVQASVASRVLVTFGGGDPGNGTAAAIRALGGLRGSRIEARVLVGPANPRARHLRALAEEAGPGVALLEDTSDMVGLMEWSEVAITSAGSTCWEFAYMGVPMILVVLAENQAPIADSLSTAGLALTLGWHRPDIEPALRNALEHLTGAPEIRRDMALGGHTLVDGAGATRVVDRVMKHAATRLS